MEQQDTKPEELKAERPTVLKGEFIIRIGVFMAHPEDERVGDFVECEPLRFGIYDTKNKKAMPDNLIKQLREVLERMVELSRMHAHRPLPKQQASPLVSSIELIKKPDGPPTVELYRQLPTGGLIRVDGPKSGLVDAQGIEIARE
jgi:hypothetical protein